MTAIYNGQILTAQRLQAIGGGGSGGITPANNIYNFSNPDNTGGTDTSAAVKAAHDAAFAAGYRYLYFPLGTYNCASLSACGNVIFVGPGKITGAYRKYVIPEHATQQVLYSGVVPSQHLKVFNAAVAAATPSAPAIVALWGDSTTANGGDSIQFTEQQYNDVKRRLYETYGAQADNIVVYNRGIGGQTWTTAITSTLGSMTQYNWYIDPSQSWAHYVQITNPDLVIFNFGQNDGVNFDIAAMQTCVGFTKAWSKVPDLLFMTPYSPSLQTIATYSSQANQEGRDFVAGYTRTYCNRYGYGLIDQNRIARLERDGFDICDQQMSEFVNTLITPIPYTFPQTTQDFAVVISVNGSTVWSTGILQINLSSKNGNVLLLERDSATGFIAYTVNAGIGTDGHTYVSRARTVTAITAPTANATFQIEIDVKGSKLFVTLQDSSGDPGFPAIVDTVVERHGGLFTPVVSFTNGTTGFTNKIIRANVSSPVLYMPEITDFEEFGGSNPTGAGGTLQPGGGNGINHLSSLGHQKIMTRAFNITALA